MGDPFKIEGPAIISFSGGRSSGLLLYRIVQAHGGSLPDDIKVAFDNTGKERAQTLDFVRDCGERWDVDIVWLEYADAEKPSDRWRRVSYETASRHGEPFNALISMRGYLPNPATRFCTQELKVNATHRWAKTIGMGDADRIIGFRADEPKRIANIRARENGGGDPWLCRFPLAAAGITKADVAAFWKDQNFDLGLPSINSATPHGNCDLCFLKGARTISEIIRRDPSLAQWWIDAEALGLASKPSGARFRNDRPSYAEMAQAVREQRGFDFGDLDEINDCVCGA